MTVALADFDLHPLWWRPQPVAAFDEAVTESVSVVRPTVSPASTASSPRWLDPTLERMLQISHLGLDWDGRGSAPVRRDALAFALDILGRAMAPSTTSPSIIPLGHGGVQLVWSNDAAELEVEVVQPNEIVIYYLDRRTGGEQEWDATTEFSSLATLLRSEFTP